MKRSQHQNSVLHRATPAKPSEGMKKQRPASASCIGKRTVQTDDVPKAYPLGSITQKTRPQSSHSRRRNTPMKEGPITCTAYETGSEVREEIKEKSRLNIRNQRLSSRYFLTSMQLIGKINGGADVQNKERRLALERLKLLEELHLKSVAASNDLINSKKEEKSKYSNVPSRVFQSPSKMNQVSRREEHKMQPKDSESKNLDRRTQNNHRSHLSKTSNNSAFLENQSAPTLQSNTDHQRIDNTEKIETKRRVLRGKSSTNLSSFVSAAESTSDKGQLESHPNEPNNATNTTTSQEDFKKILQYSSHIGTTRVAGKHNNQLNGPYDVKIHPTHQLIIISDSNNSRIQFFNMHSHDFQFSISTPSTPHCVAVSSFDNSIVVSCQNNFVYKYNLETKKLIWKAGGEGSGKSQFHFPLGIVVDESDSNKIYVCDSRNHRVQCLSSDGAFLNDFSLGPSFSPFSIDISQHGYLVVCDNRNSCVYVFQKDGSLVRTTDHGFKQPLCVSVDHTSGNAYICDSNNLRIVILDSECKHVIESVGSYSTYMLHPAKPLGISVHESTLVVADYENHRVLQAHLE
ncbi:hypothetical protein C9374_014301 [Naegleria lovaniensis]|uniref:Uncharacterized protein n=1 Tax=Naegleria lovaniensis TaxID=51637 RepID=A0AA88GAL1_NAELO|nr:uncharacterized protein C9374_014301 [Naegleria lovaniensis]KAG2370710.1 hypothetical protein C9374_014301 [Naegleria lovaniensis]